MTEATSRLSVRQRQRHIARWHLGPARDALEHLEEIMESTPRWRFFLRRRQERHKASLEYRIAELRWAAGTSSRKGHPGPPPKL